MSSINLSNKTMTAMEKVASFSEIAQIAVYNGTYTEEDFEDMGIDMDVLAIALRGNATELDQAFMSSTIELIVSAGNDSYSGVDWLYPVAVSIAERFCL